jgi:hypothetical protein
MQKDMLRHAVAQLSAPSGKVHYVSISKFQKPHKLDVLGFALTTIRLLGDLRVSDPADFPIWPLQLTVQKKEFKGPNRGGSRAS